MTLAEAETFAATGLDEPRRLLRDAGLREVSAVAAENNGQACITMRAVAKRGPVELGIVADNLTPAGAFDFFYRAARDAARMHKQ